MHWHVQGEAVEAAEQKERQVKAQASAPAHNIVAGEICNRPDSLAVDATKSLTNKKVSVMCLPLTRCSCLGKCHVSPAK